MALDINKVGNYNGKTFLGNSSAKPIAGVATQTAFSFNISQGKLSGDEIIVPGEPVEAKNTNTGSAAGKGLNPNVLTLTKPANAAAISGFLLVNNTDVLDFGEEAPRAFKGQVVNVALLGSRTELYLPVDAGVADKNVNSKLSWDLAAGHLKVDAAGTIDLLSPVVDGVRIKNNNNTAEYEAVKVARVRV